MKVVLLLFVGAVIWIVRRWVRAGGVDPVSD